MSNHEAKWKANQEKVAFLKQFPGLIQTWQDTEGKTVQAILPLSSNSKISVIVFSNGDFTLAQDPETEPKYVREGIENARPTLEMWHQDAFTHYDVLADRDKQATKSARLENILGAIHNNLHDIPELKDRIRSLVKEWNS